MNFIESLKTIKADNRYILNLGCYISRFNISFAYKISNINNIF